MLHQYTLFASQIKLSIKNMWWFDFCQRTYISSPVGGAVVHLELRDCPFFFSVIFQAFCLQLDQDHWPRQAAFFFLFFFSALQESPSVFSSETVNTVSTLFRSSRQGFPNPWRPSFPPSINHMIWLKMWVIVFVTAQDSPGHEMVFSWLAARRERDFHKTSIKLGVEHNTYYGAPKRSRLCSVWEETMTDCKLCSPDQLHLLPACAFSWKKKKTF